MSLGWKRFLVILLVAGLLVPGSVTVANAVQAEDRILVRVENPLSTLDLVDDWLAAGTQGPPPTQVVRDMIKGGEWIDPSRVIVFSLGAEKQSPEAWAVVPFSQPRPAFQAEMGAQVDEENQVYVLTWPTAPAGEERTIPEDAYEVMIKASNEPTGQTVLLEIPMAAMAEELRAMTGQGIAMMEQGASGDEERMARMENARQALGALVELAGQVEFINIGVALSPDELSFTLGGKPVRGTGLDRVIEEQPAAKSILASFRPLGDVIFRSREINTRRLVDTVVQPFVNLGGEEMEGFTCMLDIYQEFTGEVVSTTAFAPEGPRRLGMARLRRPQPPDAFVEQKLMGCLETMAEEYQKMMIRAGAPSANSPLVPLRKSFVGGVDVYGFRWTLPRLPVGANVPPMPLDTTEVRLTTVDDLLLFAPDDREMEQLIVTARALTPEQQTGPVVSMRWDMAAFFDNVLNVELTDPRTGAMRKPGEAVFQLDFKDRRVDGTFTLKLDDVQLIVANLKGIMDVWTNAIASYGIEDDVAAPGATAALSTAPGARPMTAEELKRMELLEKLRKADLALVYGGPKSAIGYYEEAMEMGGDKPRIYFAIGVARSELGEYDEALKYMNTALSMEPGNAKYIYGRGRTYLLTGKLDRAMTDFERAAALGHREAREYLDKVRRKVAEQ
ncbi:MAG: tetratricopeptide repeat protein [Desulfatibacillaceae bacterium]